MLKIVSYDEKEIYVNKDKLFKYTSFFDKEEYYLDFLMSDVEIFINFVNNDELVFDQERNKLYKEKRYQELYIECEELFKLGKHLQSPKFLFILNLKVKAESMISDLQKLNIEFDYNKYEDYELLNKDLEIMIKEEKYKFLEKLLHRMYGNYTFSFITVVFNHIIRYNISVDFLINKDFEHYIRDNFCGHDL